MAARLAVQARAAGLDGEAVLAIVRAELLRTGGDREPQPGT
jgi:hypothetical protein